MNTFPLPEACQSRRYLQELNGPITLFPHLPPPLIHKRTWHPGLNKMVILRLIGVGALGRPRGMVWGRRREEGSGWGTHVYLWRIHFDIWQN